VVDEAAFDYNTVAHPLDRLATHNSSDLSSRPFGEIEHFRARAYPLRSLDCTVVGWHSYLFRS
jgi:hypothetical protein